MLFFQHWAGKWTTSKKFLFHVSMFWKLVVPKKNICKKFRNSKWLILVNKKSERLQKCLAHLSMMRNCDFFETSKCKFHSFAEISHDNVHKPNLKWSFSLLDSHWKYQFWWQKGYVTWEVHMSCVLISAISRARFFTCSLFWTPNLRQSGW